MDTDEFIEIMNEFLEIINILKDLVNFDIECAKLLTEVTVELWDAIRQLYEQGEEIPQDLLLQLVKLIGRAQIIKGVIENERINTAT